MEHASYICGHAVTRDGTKIISSYEGGGVTVWDVESHDLVKEWTHPGSYPIVL